MKHLSVYWAISNICDANWQEPMIIVINVIAALKKWCRPSETFRLNNWHHWLTNPARSPCPVNTAMPTMSLNLKNAKSNDSVFVVIS